MSTFDLKRNHWLRPWFLVIYYFLFGVEEWLFLTFIIKNFVSVIAQWTRSNVFLVFYVSIVSMSLREERYSLFKTRNIFCLKSLENFLVVKFAGISRITEISVTQIYLLLHPCGTLPTDMLACSVAKCCLTPWDPMDYSSPVPLSMGLPWQECGAGCHFLLQRVFLIQGLNLHLLHWQASFSHCTTFLEWQAHASHRQFYSYDQRILQVLIEGT